jgi:tetratricopeptide (TPR) repeat protein
MGVVYRARDTKLERTVALKFLPQQWCQDDAAKQRFLREAQAASATNHGNICIIHDIEQTDDGQLFIVMAYYEGQTLKERLEQGPLPVADAIEAAAEIAEGLAKAHSQGVVHRDIKPGNIMVTEDGVKILDFGLAKLADAALKLTLEGSTLGTVAYMSPEQARGEEADERSDIWALGVVLYEAIAGEVPFKGAYSEAIFWAIKNEDPLPLARDGRDVPDDVERIVRRALQKDPAARYQNARELARELRHLQGRSLPLDLRTEPVPVQQIAQRATGTATAAERTRRSLLIRLAGVALILAVAAGGIYLWLARPLPRTPVAIVPVANRTGEQDLEPYRLALTQSLITELSDSPNLRITPYQRLLEVLRRHVGSGDISSQQAISDIAKGTEASLLIVPALNYADGAWTATAEIRNVETGTAVGSVRTAPVTSALPSETVHGLIAPLAGRIQEQFPIRWPHRVPARPPGSRFANVDAARAFEVGTNAYERLEYAEADAAFRQVVQYDSQRPIGHAWISRIALLMGDRNAAEAAASTAGQNVTAETSEADAVFTAAVLADARNDFEGAAEGYRRVAALRQDDAAAQAELADFLKRRGRNVEAIESYHKVLALDPAFVRVNVDLCQVYARTDDYPLAIKHAQAALTAYQASANRAGEAQALLCFGDVQRGQGGVHLAEAQQTVERARVIFESLGHPYGLSRVYQYLGATAGEAGDYPQAAKYFEEALSRSRQVRNRQLEALELMNLGVVYGALGQRSAALKYYQQARDFYQQLGDERRAAEQEVNAASLLVQSGINRADALRRVEIARATLRKLGAVEFDVFAMQVKGVSSVYAGDPAEGMRELRAALSVAKDRHLNNRIVAVTNKLAEASFITGDVDAARSLLEDLVAQEIGRNDAEAHVTLARVYVRLGNLETARRHGERAMSIIDAGGVKRVAPAAYLAMGEIAYAAGDLAAARRHFERSAASTDELVDAASVEAKCYQGILELNAGKAAAGGALVQTAVDQALRMARQYLADRCRDQLKGHN